LVLILPQSALADGLGISNLFVTDITTTTATISWTTNTSSDSRVYYGTTKPPSKHEDDSTEVTNHYIILEYLEPDTVYYFAVESGNLTNDNGGEYWSFETLPVPAGYYKITLDSVYGVCGEVIGVTALVPMAGTYHVCWDSLTAVKETFTATGPGSHEVAFFLPEATKGIHKVYLVDNTYAKKAEAEYEVGPSVKIAPEEGPVQTAVTLNGYGFTASQQIQVKFKGTIIQTTTANTVGSWNVTYTIPATPAGGYTFDIEAKEGTDFWPWVSKYFEVTPKITVSADSGKVGQPVDVKGTGFASKEKDIKITLGGKLWWEITSAEENGSWSTTIAVPPVERGEYEIVASGRSTRARDVPPVSFTVDAGISVEPISAYVGDTIAVEGGGFASGQTGIRVYLDGQLVSDTTITADPNGCWESSFSLPTSAYGSHTVSASGDILPAVNANLNTKAKVTGLSKFEGAPGDSISLTGNGFGSNKTLTVQIDGIAASEDMRTLTNGNVAITFQVPKGSTVGTRTLVVTDEGGANPEGVDFTVMNKTLSTTPLPISPKDSTLRSGLVTFHWQEMPSGDGFNYTYTLEISQSPGSAGIWSNPGITESSYQLKEDEALPKGTYYWRVKIVDDYGNESAWSDSTEFRVSPIPTWVWVVVGLVVLVGLMVVAYRETKFKVTE